MAIHSSKSKPKGINFSSTGIANIDRLQSLDATFSFETTKINEIGRESAVGVRRSAATGTLSLPQVEYGSLDFFKLMTGVTGNTITGNDFRKGKFDATLFVTDDNNGYESTYWYEDLRVNSFGLNISDPDSLIERTFDFNSAGMSIWQHGNKRIIALKSTFTASTTNVVIGTSPFADHPTPVVDPDNSGSYLLKVYRYRSSVSTKMNLATTNAVDLDYTYNSTSKTFTPYSPQKDDVYTIIYSAADDSNNVMGFISNDTDTSGVSAANVNIYLQTSQYLHSLQSVTCDTSFDRSDLKEIGNDKVISSGVNSIEVSVVLGKILESSTMEEVLRNVSTSTQYGKIDIDKFSNNIKLVVEVYKDAAKTDFLIGYSYSGLYPTEYNSSLSVEDYINAGVTLQCQDFKVSSSKSSL